MEDPHIEGFKKFVGARPLAREKFDKYLLHEVAQHNETMRALALISGALATGVLVLLTSKVPVHLGLAIYSVILFGLTTCVCIFVMVKKHRDNFRLIYDYKEKVLDVMDIMNLVYLDYFRGQISKEDLESRLVEYNNRDLEASADALKKNLSEGYKDKVESGILTLTLLGGMLSLVVSLVLPYILFTK